MISFENCMTTPAMILFFSLSAAAQNDRIEADRPSETQGVETIKPGGFQAELGLRRQVEIRNEIHWSQPRTVLRAGIFNGFELRAELVPHSVHEKNSSVYERGLLPVELGFKATLWKGNGALPAAAFYTQVGIPALASPDFRTSRAQPKIRLLLENKITDKLKLGWNLGAEWDGEETKPQWLYTLSPELELGKNWELFAEVYGYFGAGGLPEHTVDAGLSYYAGKNIKLDLSAGIGLSSAAPVNFAALGASFHLGK